MATSVAINSDNVPSLLRRILPATGGNVGRRFRSRRALDESTRATKPETTARLTATAVFERATSRGVRA